MHFKWVVCFFLIGVLSFQSNALSFDSDFGFPLIPDSELTNGDLCSKSDPDFSCFRYSERIPYCKRNVDRHRKQKIYDEYDVPRRCRKDYIIDHFIPLSIGGSNSDDNLWPEHWRIRETRPDLEHDVFLELKHGEISQFEAVEKIVREKTKLKDKYLKSIFKDNCD